MTKCYDWIPNTMTEYQILWPNTEYYDWILNTMTEYHEYQILWILIEVCSTYEQLSKWLSWLHWGLSHKKETCFPLWEGRHLLLAFLEITQFVLTLRLLSA